MSDLRQIIRDGKGNIYKITSPSNKIYIGQSLNIKRRFNEYKGLRCKSQTKLYHSFLKYGVENHVFEIVEECDIEYLNEREIYWGLFFDTINKGLNLKLGKGKGLVSNETRNKISNSLKNHSSHYTECVLEKMRKPKPKGFGRIISEKLKGKPSSTKGKLKPFKGRISPNKGNNYKHSIESNMKKFVPILQLDKYDNIIKEWECIKYAREELNIVNIPLALSGANKTAGGFKWIYKK